MDYSNRWQIIKEIGQGGQGKVFRVYDTSKVMDPGSLDSAITSFIQQLSATTSGPEVMRKSALANFRSAVTALIRMDDPSYHGALKVLHQPEDARNAATAQERIQREIEAMATIVHPNLLTILEADPDAEWFVSQFHPQGTLADNQHRFVGNFVEALRAFRPLVEGVAELHKKDTVHRDIKPQNVFLDAAGRLILGDFGLVFFTDERHTRISGTVENVGSRDWMPPWATSRRIEDLKPSFDVYSLGKLLWFMLSGQPILPREYYDSPEYDVTRKSRSRAFIRYANAIFKRCIVEKEQDCFPHALPLLDMIDQCLYTIDQSIDLFTTVEGCLCKMCGRGWYENIQVNVLNLLPPYNNNALIKSFKCNQCGNLQIFASNETNTPT